MARNHCAGCCHCPTNATKIHIKNAKLRWKPSVVLNQMSQELYSYTLGQSAFMPVVGFKKDHCKLGRTKYSTYTEYEYSAFTLFVNTCTFALQLFSKLFNCFYLTTAHTNIYNCYCSHLSVQQLITVILQYFTTLIHEYPVRCITHAHLKFWSTCIASVWYKLVYVIVHTKGAQQLCVQYMYM